MDTIQAAILNVKLKYIEQYHSARISTANSYNDRFNGIIETPYVIPDVRHIYHQYSVRVPERDKLRDYLSENGIPSMIYYPVPLHLQEAYTYNYKQGDFPVSEKVAKDIISLPMHTELTESQIDFISGKVIDFLKSR